MEETIKLRVKKGIDHIGELKVMKLKGAVISKGFTEIIHIADEDKEHYLNSFSTSTENKKEAEHFILNFISNHNLADTITLLDARKKKTFLKK